MIRIITNCRLSQAQVYEMLKRMDTQFTPPYHIPLICNNIATN